MRVQIRSNRLPALIRTMPREVDDAIEGLAREGERIVKMSMRSTTRGANGHSVAGSPPAIDSGALINSINVRKPREFARIIGAGTDYAMGLEFGTGRVAARPFMQPMATRIRGMIPQWFRERFRDW